MIKKIGVILFIGVFFVLEAQQKKIYIAPDDHTDYMWTGNEEQYKNAFLETIDYYIKLNDSTTDEPYAYQSKWNCDGSYWVYNYEKNRSKEQFNKLIEQIKNGRITVSLNTLIGFNGVCPMEASLRSMYYAGTLERKYGLDLNLAYTMEDQVMPLGLASIWAGSGAKYSWHGVCNCATKVHGFENRLNQMYWYKGLDDQKVLMKWYSLNGHVLGSYGEAGNDSLAILQCKKLMDNNSNYPYTMAAAFGMGGDDLKTMRKNYIDNAKQRSDSNYQIIISNEIDYLSEFERKYGNDLPSEIVSYGSTEWGNSLASMAELSASVKRSVEKLRTAEALYTFVTLKDKTFCTDLIEIRTLAWNALGLYYEHDWTADSPKITRKERADWQRKIAKQITIYVDTLYNRSTKKLGELINHTENKNERFYVFNSLGWNRTDYCDLLYSGSTKIHVMDISTKKNIPFQFIQKKEKQYLRIVASDIPSIGYKVFEIVKGKVSDELVNAATINGDIIETNFYKISFTTDGSIKSLVDKRTQYEYIKPIHHLYFNDLGIMEKQQSLPLKIENNGSVSTTFIAKSITPIAHTTKLTLFANNDRIEIENYIEQNLSSILSYSFSFNILKPDIWHEEAGAIIHAKPVSKGGHYAESICRLDWLGLNHFIDISDSLKGMTISNRDAYFMKTGNSTVDSLDYKTPQISILAEGQIDADKKLGIENQDGDSYLEDFFALKPHTKYNASKAMVFSLEHQNPLIAGKVTGTSGYSDKTFSLFSCNNPNVVLWTLKPSEEGIENGVILRIWNLSNQDQDCIISSIYGIQKYYETTHIESDICLLKPINTCINITVGHNKVQTFRIFFNKPL